MCVGQGCPKLIFALNPNYIYHMRAKLFDPVDLTSRLIKFEICTTVSWCFYAQKGKKNNKIFFMPYTTTKFHFKNGKKGKK